MGRRTRFVDSDILVIGGGFGGCGAAYEARYWGRDLKIVVVEKANVERFIYWMQTWVHDLLRVRQAGEARHHGDLAPALKARARAADVEGLFALERELATARGLASHPLNARLVAEHLLMAYNQATQVKA
jgi:glycine/D-amino acid oxidase-like deaminating enzyme